MYINYNPVAGLNISEFFSQNAIMGTVTEMVEAMAGRDEVITCHLDGALDELNATVRAPDLMRYVHELRALILTYEEGIVIPVASVRTVYALGTYNHPADTDNHGASVEVIDSPYPGISFALLNVDTGGLIFTCTSAERASAIIEKHGLTVTTVGTKSQQPHRQQEA